MFHLGESQELYVVKEVGFGIYLGEEENATEKVPVSYTHLTLPTN